MRIMRQASLLTLCIAILFAVGACSGSGSPVTAQPQNNLDNYSSRITGTAYIGQNPVNSGHVFVYDLETLEQVYKGNIGSNGGYAVGVDAGQFLIVPVSPTAWIRPVLDENFSNYVNIADDQTYRMDIELTSSLPEGEELIFGFVTSSENGYPIVGAVISAAGRITTSDAYGFYAFTVPAGTSIYNISASGFNDLNTNIREAQATGDYFKTPFFNLNPTNKVGGSIGGVVRDVTNGNGLGGVRVTLMMPGNPLFIDAQYLTNLGGQYRFYNLAEGIYKLYFERPGYVSGSRDSLVLIDQDDAIINVFMNVDASGRASISGSVRNSGTPLPVSNARVSFANPLLGARTAVTGPTGSYMIDSLVPGNYTITVTAPGAGVTFYESMSTFQTIVEGPNTLNFALRFIQEGVLRGTVSIFGGVGSSFSFPPTGVEVTAEKVGGPLSGVKWKTTSDGKGIFVFNGLPAGTYLVRGSIAYSTTESFFGQMANIVVTSGSTTNIDLQLVPE